MEKDSSSNGKRFRGNDNEPQGSLKRMKASSVQTFEVVDSEEMQAQMRPNEKARGDLQSTIDAKLRPDAGSRVCESKPSQSRFPINARRKWSNDQEICLMNAILETRKPNGDVDWKAFYELAREQLRGQVSNHKLYEKMKNMNKKFRSMVKEKKEGKLTIQTPHQETMFLLWEKHWGTFNSERDNPQKKETESSRPHETEAENSNSTENPGSPRENPLNLDSAKHLKNREIRAIHTRFAEASDFRENFAVNATNVDSTVNFDSQENPNFAANPNIMENKDKQSLQEVTHRENTNLDVNASIKHTENKVGRSLQEEIYEGNIYPDFTASPNHTENKVERSLREETQGETTRLPEESVHQEDETCMENARANGHFVDKLPHQEIHVGNAREIGHFVDCFGLEQIQLRGFESRIETFIENTIKGIETRLEASIQKSIEASIQKNLEASIQNSVSRVVIAAVTAAASVSVAAVFYICAYLIGRGTS